MPAAPKAIFVTFHATIEAFTLKKACEAAGIPGRLRTIPRTLSAGCGLAWTSPIEHAEQLRHLLENDAAHISYEEIAEL